MTASQVPPGDTATLLAAHQRARTPFRPDWCEGCAWVHDDCGDPLADHAQHVAAVLAESGFGDLSGLLTDLRALADQLRGISKHELTVQDLDDLAARYTPDDPQETP